ncbi:MAG: hypothetical protein VX498_12855 [Myxococcota bacterium]|nr:hypothetical protein [Myxococcota bacterium]
MNSEQRPGLLPGLFRSGVLLLALGMLSACFVEDLPQQNLDGQVIVRSELLPDARQIGMLYIGIFEAFDPEQLGYPYPQTAPRVGDNPIGDALPYGGTSVGQYAYGCYRAVRCQIISGRYASLNDFLEINPVETDQQEPATAEDLYDQCSWYYGWNSLEEFSFIGPEQLDFTEDENGDWVADFRAWHTRLPAGAILWGFADNDFTSCSVDQGAINRRQDDDGNYFREGTNFNDVLNFPDKYITDGDLVSSEPTVLEEGRTEGYSLVLDYWKD